MRKTFKENDNCLENFRRKRELSGKLLKDKRIVRESVNFYLSLAATNSSWSSLACEKDKLVIRE